MRLQLSSCALGLAVLALAVAAAPGLARAQADDDTVATGGVRLYADDDHVTVWSPWTTGHTTVGDAVRLDATAAVDAVTAASIDVVSAASPRTVHELRLEGDVGAAVGYARDRWAVVRAALSDERDYTAARLGVGWRGELAERNLTLELAYTLGRDTVGRTGDPTFARARHEQRLVISATQILDRRGYLDVVVDLLERRGYQASPYRFVPIATADGSSYSLPEEVPTSHLAAAALARLRRAVGEGWFVHADYRLTLDSWAMTSHTASARVLRAMADDRHRIGLEVRGYLQGAASFYRARYTDDGGAPAWRSRDHGLGRMRALSIGALADAGLPWPALRLTASATWIHFAWLDDVRQSHRDALVATLALRFTR